jgi:BirA family biotin operon repressor/biotin-[acetyl-CoA-carboxylase] ligase
MTGAAKPDSALPQELQTGLNSLLPERLLPLLRGTIFNKVTHYHTIASTNDAAMESAARGAPEGSVFLAEQQMAGRGRGDHEWHSAPSSGIYCSVILRPRLAPSEILILSLAVGLAVYDAVQSIDSRIVPDLKWPNDVILNGKKFCGILTEMSAELTRIRYIVVGVGINANQFSFPLQLRSTATSLRLETGSEWSRLELCAALLKSLDREYRALTENPPARKLILQRFEQHSSMVKEKRVAISEEKREFEGVTEGLDDRGFLKVRTDDGMRTVLSGTVRVKE